jgi:hypothetical protein
MAKCNTLFRLKQWKPENVTAETTKSNGNGKIVAEFNTIFRQKQWKQENITVDSS